MKSVCWVLDVYVNGEHAILWIKSEDGKVLRLIDHYTPDFYVEPKEKVEPEELEGILLNHPNVLHVVRENKFTSVNMKEKSLVSHVYIDYVKNFRRVLKDIENLGLVKAYYNIDILHVQRYLFHRGFAPTNKVEVEYDERGRLLCLHVLNDDLEIKPPPFTALIFDIHIESQKLTAQVEKDPISKIVVLDENLGKHRRCSSLETLGRSSHHLAG